MTEQPSFVARYVLFFFFHFDRLLKCSSSFLSAMSLLVFLREAKSIHQSLKELLKTKEPFDKEVDFQRKRYIPFI